MKRLFTLAACTLLALCSWAQQNGTLDFAAHFMQDNADNEAVKCITVGPKMLGSLLAENSNGKADFKDGLDGIKSIRIVTAETDDDQLRADAVTLLTANRKRYTQYRKGGKAKYGDCLWIRKVKGRTVELVYVAPHSEKKFMVMDFTGQISDNFIEKLVKNGES